jgi:hypothetical protein
LVAVLAAALAVGMAGQAFGSPSSTAGYLYKVEFEGEGVLKLTDADGLGNTIEQNATWAIKPEPFEIWLPKVTEPRGAGNELKTTASSSAKLSPSGKVTQTGTYAESPSPVAYECSGPVEDNVGAQDTAEVGPYTTEVALTTDFAGTFIAGTGVFGNQGGMFGDPYAVGSCDTDPELAGETQRGNFFYFWDPEMPTSEVNQRMEVGDLIPPQDIGLTSFGLVAQDYSYVNQSTGCEYNAPPECGLEFKLSGSYELTLVCGGSVENGSSGSGGCGGSGSSSGSNENKNPSQNTGGGKQAEEEARKKEEAAKAAAAKKAEEEKKAEEKKKAEEAAKKKRAEEEAKASVKIESVRLTSSNLQIKIRTSEKGTVTLTGAELKRISKILPAGIHTARVDVSKKTRAKHEKIRLTVSLRVGKKTVTASERITL